ncbi:MAG: hypothetical protein IT361_07240 [Gemmatimonadaceae bacterium]|nr:hypothetical protein [Gemmatimonadaceae bacterium]
MVQQGHAGPILPTEEPTLGAQLHRLSLLLSDAQAAIACGAGAVIAAAVLTFAPSWWRVALGGVAIASFGAWIVLERSGSERAWRRVVQGMAIVAGTGSVFAIALSLLTPMLGIWIS